MGFASVSQLAQGYETTGKNWTSWFHKTGSPILTGAGYWADLSMAAGIPKYNAYVGVQNEGTPMIGVGNFGLNLGPNPASGETKHITDMSIQTASATFAPGHFILCDYTYIYALTDMDNTDLVYMDNGVSPVPRYADGAGVHAMLVTTTPQTAAGVAATITYTDANGTPNKTSTIYTQITNTGMIQGAQASSGAASSQSPFIPWASGTTGIRTIDSIQMAAPAGGFCAIVLVKPLAAIVLREQNTVTEKDFFIQNPALPRVYDGAYLNMIFTSGATAVSSVIRGSVDFAWS